MGGLAWMRKARGTLNIDEIAPKPEPFDGKQRITVATIVAYVILILLPLLPEASQVLPKWAIHLFSNVGAVAFLLSGILMLCGAANVRKSIARVPWFVLTLVCGVTVLVEVMDKTGGLNVLVELIGSISTPLTLHFWVALIAGIISAYSSSSGVVMPMFLPLVPGLMRSLGIMGTPGQVAYAIALISTVNVGAHMVDTSPLSTLGALCVACAPEHEDKSKLFRNLLVWGLSMSVVGGVVYLLFFGILGL